MEPSNPSVTNQPPSKLRVILMWLLMVGVIAFWVVFWLVRKRGEVPADESEHGMVASILSLVVGAFFLGLGLAIYLAAVFTGCFSFSYRRSVWPGAKVRMYFLNIVVTVLIGLGFGFLLSAFVRPLLLGLGLDAGIASMLPVMITIGGIQVGQLWVLMWSPMERRLILNRLEALGIKPAQLQNAFLVGLSNPASGFKKRFGSIEEDMGALWVGPEQLIFWGDVEQFSIAREQIVEIVRKADNRSTSMLAGIAHVILHVRLADSSVRQIRLHTEGLLTMGRKRQTMDALAGAINHWYSNLPN